MTVRVLSQADWPDVERLYLALTNAPGIGGFETFAAVLDHPGTRVFGYEAQEKIVSMATLHLLPNVTYAGRPYGLIENVVTARGAQRQGFGRAVLGATLDASWEANAYKVMLMTGHARGARGFYEAVGFRADEKWGMVIRRS